MNHEQETPRHIRLRVGDSATPPGCVDMCPIGYLPSAEAVSDFVRMILQSNPDAQTFSTNSGSVCLALFLLHKQREIDCTNVYHVPTAQTIRIDYRGEFIEPWPDELFEVDFYLLFSTAKK